jgi:hypothetical protein
MVELELGFEWFLYTTVGPFMVPAQLASVIAGSRSDIQILHSFEETYPMVQLPLVLNHSTVCAKLSSTYRTQ